MFSLKESIFGKKIEETLLDIKPEVETTEPYEAVEEPAEAEDKEQTETPRDSIIDEITKGLQDLTDDELDVLLDVMYSIVLADEEVEGDEDLKEAFIDHQTSQEKTAMKMKRRLPKWKRKAKIRYFRNKKCPAGTSWSSTAKSCTHINIDMSRLQKIISKMKIRSK